MSWNYRLAEKYVDYGEYDGIIKEYRVVEAYYNEDGSIQGVTNFKDPNGWDNLDCLKGTLEKMLSAFDKPIIGYFDAEGEFIFYEEEE